jgi:hypothetical protein
MTISQLLKPWTSTLRNKHGNEQHLKQETDPLTAGNCALASNAGGQATGMPLKTTSTSELRNLRSEVNSFIVMVCCE